MVGVDDYGVDQVLDEGAPVGRGCFVPDRIDVEGLEDRGDLLELLGEFATFRGLRFVFEVGGGQRLDLGGESALFVVERLGGRPRIG